MYKKTGARGEVAKAYCNLADLFLNQGRLDEAEDYAHQARKIRETLDLSAEPWNTFSILAGISERRGKKDEAIEWRRKEQEAYAAFAGSDQTVEQWMPIIEAVVAAAQGNQQAASELEAILQDMSQSDDWRNLASVIRRILEGSAARCSATVWAGGTAAIIVREILGRLSGQIRAAVRGTSSAESEDSPEGLSLDQLLSMVELAAQGNSILRDKIMPAMEQLAQAEMLRTRCGLWAECWAAFSRVISIQNWMSCQRSWLTPVRGMISRLKK